MAARAVRVLRRPAYSALSRTLAVSSPASSSSSLINPVAASDFRICSQGESLHLLRGRSASFASTTRFLTSDAGETASKPGVIEVSNTDEYKRLLKDAKDNKRLAVVYFTAQWCGPCRHISPVVKSLSEEFKDIRFLKVDLDETALQEAIEAAGISAVPTFQFHLGGKLVYSFSGADSKRLRSQVEQLLLDQVSK